MEVLIVIVGTVWLLRQPARDRRLNPLLVVVAVVAFAAVMVLSWIDDPLFELMKAIAPRLQEHVERVEGT